MAELVVKLVNGELAGKTVQSLRKEINAAAREAAKAEIGTKKWIDAHARLDKAKKLQEDLKKQIDSTAKSSDVLRSAFDRFVPFSGKFRQIGESLGIVSKGVGGLTRGMGLLKAALVSTGIGALVVLLGSLVTWLTSTQEGMDKLTSVMRPLGTIFQRLLGVVQELGGEVFKRLSEAISNPRQAFIDLGNAIKENLLSRFEALGKFGPALAKIFRGEFAAGFKDLGNAAIQATTGIENAIDKIGDAADKIKDFVDEAWQQGKRLDELQKQIEKAEIRRIVRSKQLELIVAQQKKIAEDETASFDERRAAAIAAMEAQEQLIKLEQDVLDKRIKKLELEHSLNDTSREDEKELAELRAQRLQVEARLTEQSIELRNKLNQLDKQQLAEQKAIQKSLQDLRLEAMKEGLAKEIEQVERETAQRIEALKGSEEEITEQRELLEKIRQDKIRELRDQFAKEQQEKDLEAARAQHELDLITQQNLLNELFLARQISEDEFAIASAENAIRRQEELLQLIREQHGQQSIEYQRAYGEFLGLQREYSDRSIDISEKEASAKRAVQQAQLDFASGALDITIGLLGEDEEARKKNAAAIKAFTIAKILVDLQTEIAGYFANPASTATLGIIGGLKAALAIVRAGVAVRSVSSQKFSQGGILDGPSHARGGVPILGRSGKVYGEAEGGEIILTKGVSRDPFLLGLASTINELGGGRKFEAGGPIDPFVGRSDASTTTERSLLNLDKVTSKLDEMIALQAELISSQDRRMDRIKVVNVVTETEEGIKTLNKIRDRADV